MSAREKTKHFSVRCFAFSHKNEGRKGYIAVCIDLNLVTWRPTAKEAKASLEDAILGYLETAIKLAEAGVDLGQLLHRPVPIWPYRVMYRWHTIRRALFSFRRQESYLFEEPIDLLGRLLPA